MRSNKDSIAYIGYRHGWGSEIPFGLLPADRRQHLYIVGKTGTGKTTLLQNLIVQDIHAGRGVGVIDPHGDLAESLLDFIPPWRTDHLVYFKPADEEYPVGFNVLRSMPQRSRHLAVSGIVSAFKSIWRDSWGPRLEYILAMSAAALLECENTTILGIPRMLHDPAYRQWVSRQIKDPVVRVYWTETFENYDPGFVQEAIAPIENKVGQLLMAAPIRNIIGQVKSKFEPSFTMDNNRIFIANLSKGQLGEDKANLLGALLVSQFQMAAMARSTAPEAEREDFLLFVDEFQNYCTDSFASILSEARKYHLGLALSNQFTSQLRPEIKEAVFGNCGTVIAFRVGERDADLLEQEFGQSYSAAHFSRLDNFEVCVKLLTDGTQADPFLARTGPTTAPCYGRKENLVRRSRERYAMPRALVEDRIRRWMMG